MPKVTQHQYLDEGIKSFLEHKPCSSYKQECTLFQYQWKEGTEYSAPPFDYVNPEQANSRI